MDDARRKFFRFNANFNISSNEICGEGLNISKNGFGVLTDYELIPAENVPFKIEIKKSDIISNNYIIKGWARLLFSKESKENFNKYYNGFEFIKLEGDSENSLNNILNEITKLQSDQ